MVLRIQILIRTINDSFYSAIRRNSRTKNPKKSRTFGLVLVLVLIRSQR